MTGLLLLQLLLAVFLVIRLGKAVIKLRISQLASKTAVDWDDLIVALTERIRSLLEPISINNFESIKSYLEVTHTA